MSPQGIEPATLGIPAGHPDRLAIGTVVYLRLKQKRSTEGCSNFKSPETRQVQERLVSTLEHMQVPKWDRTRCPEE